MNKHLIWFLFFPLILMMIGGLFITHHKSMPAITFFPLDKETSFKSSNTKLALSEASELQWQVRSKTDKPLYLRQDVSLLFANGKLKGAKSQWIEQTDTIHFNETLKADQNALWEAITFHHGERHLADDTIKSVQYMTHDYLYVIETGDQAFMSFKKADNNRERTAQQQIYQYVTKELREHWSSLITYYNIPTEKYITVPLSELYEFNNKNLPNLTRQQTDNILGQLWEGLYKSYVIPVTNTTGKQTTGYVPLILFDKQNNHLLVLFELNNKKEILIQQYSNQ